MTDQPWPKPTASSAMAMAENTINGRDPIINSDGTPGVAPPQPTAAQSLGEGGGTAFPGASDIPTGYRGPDREATNVAKIVRRDIDNPV